jgi:hypothetical protein
VVVFKNRDKSFVIFFALFLRIESSLMGFSTLESDIPLRMDLKSLLGKILVHVQRSNA